MPDYNYLNKKDKNVFTKIYGGIKNNNQDEVIVLQSTRFKKKNT